MDSERVMCLCVQCVRLNVYQGCEVRRPSDPAEWLLMPLKYDSPHQTTHTHTEKWGIWLWIHKEQTQPRLQAEGEQSIHTRKVRWTIRFGHKEVSYIAQFALCLPHWTEKHYSTIPYRTPDPWRISSVYCCELLMAYTSPTSVSGSLSHIKIEPLSWTKHWVYLGIFWWKM